MRYNHIHNNPWERATVTHSHVWWDGLFTPEELDKIIAYCEDKGLDRAKVLGRAEDDIEHIEKIRRCDLKFHSRNEDTAWIFDKLNWVIAALNDQFYGFELNGYDAFQYTSYDSKELGTYHWHMDICLGHEALPTNMTQPRKLSLTLLLNDPSEFEGGEFKLNLGNENDAATASFIRGRIIAFPSYLIHTVTPVTKGFRKSLVVWVTGPKFR